MNQAEWIESATTRARGFLRLGSIRIYRSVEGTGIAPGIEDYPFQGLDIETDPYVPWFWLAKARTAAEIAKLTDFHVPKFGTAGYCKYQGPNWLTPLGTPVAELTRSGGDMLMSSCGYCGLNVGKCRCGLGGDGE